MKLPPLVGIFPSQFPGFGGDSKPVTHRRKLLTAGPSNEAVEQEFHEYVCDMAFHPPEGPCMSCRYVPVGVSGIDHDGRCWVLVQDYGMSGRKADGQWRTMQEKLRWVVFPTEVGE